MAPRGTDLCHVGPPLSGSRGSNPVRLQRMQCSTHELLPLLVWLLITGWLTLWRRHSRVGHALLVHHPDVVLPAGPSVCAEFAAARIGVPCFTQQGRRLCRRAANRWLLPRPPHRFVM